MPIALLTPQHREAYRALRLQALKECPTAFGSSYDYEAALPLSKFAERIRPEGAPDDGIFGAFVEGDRLVGTLGFHREPRDKRRHICLLWSMYVAPEFRGHGHGGALIDAAIAHARQIGGVRQLVLAVHVNNTPACSLYRSRGFERFGLERDALFVNGEYHDEEHMVLFLHKTNSGRSA